MNTTIISITLKNSMNISLQKRIKNSKSLLKKLRNMQKIKSKNSRKKLKTSKLKIKCKLRVQTKTNLQLLQDQVKFKQNNRLSIRNLAIANLKIHIFKNWNRT